MHLRPARVQLINSVERVEVSKPKDEEDEYRIHPMDVRCVLVQDWYASGPVEKEWMGLVGWTVRIGCESTQCK